VSRCFCFQLCDLSRRSSRRLTCGIRLANETTRRWCSDSTDGKEVSEMKVKTSLKAGQSTVTILN